MNYSTETNTTSIDNQLFEELDQSTNSNQGFTMPISNVQYTTTQIDTTISDVKEVNKLLLQQQTDFASLEASDQQNRIGILGKVFDLLLPAFNNKSSSLRIDYASEYQLKQNKGVVSKRPAKMLDDKKFLTIYFADAFKGVNTKRAYAYRTVIKYALERNVKLGGFVSFVNDQGGLEKARQAKNAADRQKRDSDVLVPRNKKTVEYIQTNRIATLLASDFTKPLPKCASNLPLVLLATQLPDGSIAINDVIVDEFVETVALRAVYKNHSTQVESFIKTNASVYTHSSPVIAEDSSAVCEDVCDTYDIGELTGVNA